MYLFLNKYFNLQKKLSSRNEVRDNGSCLTRDFDKKKEKLKELCVDFDYPAELVELIEEKKIFEYLGYQFTSEGSAYSDGRIVIYYDPAMTDARMACCLVHELQHQRYFAVQKAFNSEPIDGPLHNRFAIFSSSRLSDERGISAYSEEHWRAWQGTSLPVLFSDEFLMGQSEPINETIAEIAKAYYNWGRIDWIPQLWRDLYESINEEYENLEMSKGRHNSKLDRYRESV